MNCNFCHITINGQYYRDIWGTVYCERHESEAGVQHCDCCRSLIVPGSYPASKKLRDGRIVCGNCLFDFVDNMQKLNNAYKYVVSVYNKAKVYLPLDRINLTLCNEGEIHSSSCSYPVGQTRSLISPFSKNRYCIDILSANYTYAVDTLAHELMHVVQNELNLLLNKQHSEGLCECAAYLVLQTIKSDVAKRLNKGKERSMDTIYGEGFRLVKAEIIRVGSLQAYLSRL